MEYKNLGELRVSKIAFGCMSLGTAYEPAKQLLYKALDGGINFFDTADIYDQGVNEEIIGKAFKGRREEVIIATKVGNQLRPDASGWDWNPSYDYIKNSIHKSLKRLQTDYIDLYQLHGGTIDDPIEETIAAFEELKKEGLIRAYGISSIRPNVIREYAKRSNIVSNMMQYSLLDRRPEESCLDLLKANDIGVIVRGAVANGLLAGKPAKAYLSHSEQEVEAAQTLLKKIDQNIGHAALQYCLAHPAVSTIAAGMRTEDQLSENLQVVTKGALSEANLAILKNGVKADKYEKHR